MKIRLAHTGANSEELQSINHIEMSLFWKKSEKGNILYALELETFSGLIPLANFLGKHESGEAFKDLVIPQLTYSLSNSISRVH